MIHLDEYRGISLEEILSKTGLPNPYSDQTRYSLARQKELVLRDAKRNNVLHLIEKTHPRKTKILSIQEDKDLTILSLKEEDPIEYTTNLDLNLTPHKVVRERGSIQIIVKQSDIPKNVIKNPKAGFIYNVIGIFTQEKCYFCKAVYEKIPGDISAGKRIGSLYSFGFHSKVSLLILES